MKPHLKRVVLALVIACSCQLEAQASAGPMLKESASLTGEQAQALKVAMAELERRGKPLQQYVVKIYESPHEIVVLFDSPYRQGEEEGSALKGPTTFEVTISRRSDEIVRSHFSR
jgi:hypothetical protein